MGFISEFTTIQEMVHRNAINHGWWEKERSDGEVIALIHSELSECLESLRNGNPESTKIPGHCHAVEELSDAVIRIMDYAQTRKWPLAQAIIAKHNYNIERPYKHGNKKF